MPPKGSREDRAGYTVDVAFGRGMSAYVLDATNPLRLTRRRTPADERGFARRPWVGCRGVIRLAASTVGVSGGAFDSVRLARTRSPPSAEIPSTAR